MWESLHYHDERAGPGIHAAVTMTKILIVEDEQAIREMIAFHLNRAGFETLEAENSNEARALIADERPDLARLDAARHERAGTHAPVET